MTLKDLKKEDLENIPYDDLAAIILKSNGKKMKIQALFKKICDLLKLDEKEFEDKIADFFEMLSTDKRFIMLPKGYWDLSTNHTRKIEIDDDEEEIIDEVLEDDDEEDKEDLFYEADETDDKDDDDLEDLVVIDPDAEEEGEI